MIQQLQIEPLARFVPFVAVEARPTDGLGKIAGVKPIPDSRRVDELEAALWREAPAEIVILASNQGRIKSAHRLEGGLPHEQRGRQDEAQLHPDELSERAT